MENKNTNFHPNPIIGDKVISLSTVTGKPGLPGVKCIGAAAATVAATVAANNGLWTTVNPLYLASIIFNVFMP